MSVKFHEAYCLDSQQDQLLWFDDFLGDQVQDEWRTALVGGGTVTVIDQQTGGIVRLSTPTASDQALLDWGDIRSLHIDQRISGEARIRCNNGVTDTFRRIFRLSFDVQNYIGFEQQGYDDADIDIVCEDNNIKTSADSGINVDADWHIYRIECFPTGEVHFYIDGVETANSPITTNIPDDATDYLQPYFAIFTNADSDPATSMDVDYCAVRQDR